MLDSIALQRRQFLRGGSLGLGSIALASLFDASARSEEKNRTLPKPHFAPRAKHVIQLFMEGGPSQLDLFEQKPALNQNDGKPIPGEFTQGQRFAFAKPNSKILASPFKFSQHGKSGAWVSELLPKLSAVADELCIIRSVHGEQFNHSPAQIFLISGSPRMGRPSLGSWLSYGLGSENENLPGFVVLVSGGGQPRAGETLWSSGFLPSTHQGVRFREQGEPVLEVSNPPGVSTALRAEWLSAVTDLDRINLGVMGDPEISTRIAAYELAFKMQASVPDAADIWREPKAIQELYGATPGQSSFANNCLLARRLVERGVRFVQLFHHGWDSHGTGKHDDLMTSLPARCKETDQAAAALISDLKQRGMLDDTLVIWGGEFGRTPMIEDRGGGAKFLGRDHHPHGFTMFMAGGGIKPGLQFGQTDELGYKAVENPVHVHDLQATLLHLLGLNHERLTYRFQGRDYRLTDVHGRVVKELLA